MASPSAIQDRYPYHNEPIWSKSEKVIARTAFDAALGRELHEVIQEAKKRASQIQQSLDVGIGTYLTERRKEINHKYDYRYSRLTQVVWETLVRKATRRGRPSRLTRGQVEVDPFYRPILSEVRSLTCILSAIAWFRQRSATISALPKESVFCHEEKYLESRDRGRFYHLPVLFRSLDGRI